MSLYCIVVDHSTNLLFPTSNWCIQSRNVAGWRTMLLMGTSEHVKVKSMYRPVHIYTSCTHLHNMQRTIHNVITTRNENQCTILFTNATINCDISVGDKDSTHVDGIYNCASVKA